MPNKTSYSPVWEKMYQEGRAMNRYPFDFVVSFIYRSLPKNKPFGTIQIGEMGCGVGNNLWFAAREGFKVAGIDASPTAIAAAKHRFKSDGLTGTLQVGSFTRLPWKAGSMDIVFERQALSCCGLLTAKKAIKEAYRVLKPGGKFLFNPYSKRHGSAASGKQLKNGMKTHITHGVLNNVGPLCFYNKNDIKNVVGQEWKRLQLQHVLIADDMALPWQTQAEWRVILEK